MNPSLETLSDEALAEVLQSDDTDAVARALGIIMERYEAKMLRYANRFLTHYEDRQDAVQDVFIKVYQNIRSFRVSERFSPWIYRIAHNTFINVIKKQKREQVSAIDADTFFSWGLSDETATLHHESKLDRDLLERGLAEIDVKYREVLVLYYFEEKSYKEIADIMHIPIATVGVRLKRGRDILEKS